MRRYTHLLSIIALITVLFVKPAMAGDAAALVEEARQTASKFLNDKQYEQSRDLLRRSRAVIIIPSYYRAGFIFGGSGGSGVLLAKDDGGTWSYPAFINLGGGSVGLQLGVAADEMMIFIITDRGLHSVVNNNIRFGGTAGVALANIGGGVGGSVGLSSKSDYVTLSKSVGLYGSLSLEGAAMDVRSDMIQQFYGQPAGLESILVQNKLQNPAAEPLRQLLSGSMAPAVPVMQQQVVPTPTNTPVYVQPAPIYEPQSAPAQPAYGAPQPIYQQQ